MHIKLLAFVALACCGMTRFEGKECGRYNFGKKEVIAYKNDLGAMGGTIIYLTCGNSDEPFDKRELFVVVNRDSRIGAKVDGGDLMIAVGTNDYVAEKKIACGYRIEIVYMNSEWKWKEFNGSLYLP